MDCALHCLTAVKMRLLVPMAYCLQKTVETALATVLQTAGYGLSVCADEWHRVFRMSGSVDDVCGTHRYNPALCFYIVRRRGPLSLALTSCILTYVACSLLDAMCRWQVLQHRDQDGAKLLTEVTCLYLVHLCSVGSCTLTVACAQAGRQPDRAMAVSIYLLFQPSHLRNLQKAQNADGLMQKMLYVVIPPGHTGICSLSSSVLLDMCTEYLVSRFRSRSCRLYMHY